MDVNELCTRLRRYGDLKPTDPSFDVVALANGLRFLAEHAAALAAKDERRKDLNDPALLKLWEQLRDLAKTNTEAQQVIDAYRVAFRGFKAEDVLPGGDRPIGPPY